MTQDARVVYVDDDPIVLATPRALLTSTTTTAYIDADARDTAKILGRGGDLDLAEPPSYSSRCHDSATPATHSSS